MSTPHVREIRTLTPLAFNAMRRQEARLIGLAALDRAFNGFNGRRFDIGGISTEDTRALAWGVRQGLVTKTRACWPWIEVGTCTKTLYTRTA